MKKSFNKINTLFSVVPSQRGRAFVLLQILSVMFIFFLNEKAFADEEINLPNLPSLPETPNILDSSPLEKSGVTSTMVAASLETAGYKMQSVVLRDLRGMLMSFGSLLYIASAILALAYLAVYHEYEMGLWFFIGPPLFYIVVFNTRQSAGVDWQIGRNQPLGVDSVNKVINDNVNANVSALFDEYNKVVSSIVQNLVHIIAELGVNEEETLRHQMKFMARQQLLDRLFQSRVVDGDLRWLIHLGLKGKCGEAVSAARYMALSKRDGALQKKGSYVGTPEYNRSLQIYEEEFGPLQETSTRNFSGKKIHTLPDSRGYLQGLLRQLDQQQKSGITYGMECLDPQDLENPNATVSGPVSCAQIWCWSWMGVKLQLEGEIRDIDEKEIFKKLKEEKPTIYNQIWLSIMMKLMPLPEINVQVDGGGRGKNPKIVTGNKKLDEWLEALFSVKHNRVEPDASIIPVVIAGTLLRKELTSNTDASMLAQLAEHSGYKREEFDFQPDMTRDQVHQVSERLQASGLAFAKRYDIFTFSMTLPYLQGVILYFLAMTFPFFMLLLLIPGKAAFAFNWLALWGWAKAWDVGWAIVMVVDEILWDLMPKSAVYDPAVDPRHAPITILEAAFHGDPAYNTMHYYSILSTMLIAVPIISAQAVLGGKKVIAGFLVEGLGSMGQTLGKSASDWALHSSIADINRNREMWAAKYTIGNLGHDANAGVKELRETAAATRSLGQVGKGVAVGGAVLGGLGIVAGTAASLTGFGAGVGIPMMVMGAGTMFAGTTARDKLGVSANKAMVQYNQANAAFHYYKAANQEWFRHMDAIRGGLSGRGEYWVTPDAPLGAVKQTLEAIRDAKVEQIQYGVQGGVDAGLSLVAPGVGSAVSKAIGSKILSSAGSGVISSFAGGVAATGWNAALTSGAYYAAKVVGGPVAEFLVNRTGVAEDYEKILQSWDKKSGQ